MTHHPLIPLPFNPLPSTRMSFPFPAFLFPPSPFPPSPFPLPPFSFPLPLSPFPFPPFPTFSTFPFSTFPFSTFPFSTFPFSTLPFSIFPSSTFPFSTFSFPPTLRTQSPSHHPIFNPLPSTLMSPPFPFIPPPSTRNPRLNPSRTPPPQMILTSQWLSPSTTSNTLRLTSPDSLPPFLLPSNQLPLFPSFLSLYSQHLPGSVFQSFPHKPVLLFFSKKITLSTFLPAPTTPIHMPLITFPPFKISNSANFPLPNITSPHHGFLPQISRSQHFSSTQLPLQHY